MVVWNADYDQTPTKMDKGIIEFFILFFDEIHLLNFVIFSDFSCGDN